MYKTRDGIELAGTDGHAVLQSLRQISRDGRPTLRQFMAVTARASEIQTGVVHRGETADELLADMVASGLIIKEGA
jgi:hypothetical protein